MLKKGYSGTFIFTIIKPLSINYGLNDQIQENKGCIIILEYDNFYLINVYTPNAQLTLARLPYRLAWDVNIFDYVHHLEQTKPVILTGDLNVGYRDIDLKNAKANDDNSGCTIEEREKMTRF